MPYAVLAIATVGCVQVALVALWALMTLSKRGAILSEPAFRWLDAIIAAAVVATVFTFTVDVHLLAVVEAGPALLGVFMTGVVIAGAVFLLLMIVMRGMLRAESDLQDDLAEVT